MKTILVPIQNVATMTSALQTALLLARQSNAYIEGFPLRFRIPQFVVAELAGGFSLGPYEAKSEQDVADMRQRR